MHVSAALPPIVTTARLLPLLAADDGDNGTSDVGLTSNDADVDDTVDSLENRDIV